MKKFFSLAASFLVVLQSANAFTVQIVNFATGAAAKGNTHPVTTSAGTLIASTQGVVAVGAFSSDDSVRAVSSVPSWQNVLTQFTQFASSTTSRFDGAGGLGGLFSRTISEPLNPGTAQGDSLIGKNIYTVIGNGTTLADSTEVAVYKTSNTFLADPATVSRAADLAIEINQSSLLLGRLGAATTSLYPGNATFGTTSLTPIVTVNLIPEPTSVMALAAGALAFIRRRR